jgi:Phospholipase_D-nuclease N-terminal
MKILTDGFNRLRNSIGCWRVRCQLRTARVYRLLFSQTLAYLVLLSSLPLCAFALQRSGPSNAAGAAGCAACGGFTIFVLVGVPVLSIALLIWVARDAKSRGMDSAVLWMLLVFFTNIIGLIIYLFSRPQGNLIQCPHCNNKRLQASAKCPHCGNA